MTAVSFKLPYAVIFYICQVKHNKREAGGEKWRNQELYFSFFVICAYDTIWHRGGKLIQTLSSTNIPKVASSAAPPDARSTQVKVLQYQARLFLSWIFFSLNFLFFFFSCILRNVDNVPETRCPLWLPAPISVIFAICFPQRLPFIFFAFVPLSHSLSLSRRIVTPFATCRLAAFALFLVPPWEYWPTLQELQKFRFKQRHQHHLLLIAPTRKFSHKYRAIFFFVSPWQSL